MMQKSFDFFNNTILVCLILFAAVAWSYNFWKEEYKQPYIITKQPTFKSYTIKKSNNMKIEMITSNKINKECDNVVLRKVKNMKEEVVLREFSATTNRKIGNYENILVKIELPNYLEVGNYVYESIIYSECKDNSYYPPVFIKPISFKIIP